MTITSDAPLFLLTMLTSLGCGTTGGLFFAFSAAVMKALSRIRPREGIAAMQSINIVILNPIFLAVFLGTAAGCGILVVIAFLHWQNPRSPYFLSGAASYLAGSLLVTAVANVPRNNALAAAKPDASESAELWSRYVRTWTAWNHVRTVSSLLAAALLMMALCS